MAMYQPLTAWCKCCHVECTNLSLCGVCAVMQLQVELSLPVTQVLPLMLFHLCEKLVWGGQLNPANTGQDKPSYLTVSKASTLFPFSDKQRSEMGHSENEAIMLYTLKKLGQKHEVEYRYIKTGGYSLTRR